MERPGRVLRRCGFDFEARIVLGAAASGRRRRAGPGRAGPDRRRRPAELVRRLDCNGRRAGRTRRRGAEARAPGHRQLGLSRRGRVLRQGAGLVDGLADQTVLLPTFREHRSCWEKWSTPREGCFVRVQVPYEDDHAARLSAPPGRQRSGPANVGGDQRERRLAARAARLRRRGGAGPGLERVPVRRPGPAVDAVRAGGAVPLRLGGGADPGHRRPGRPARRRRRRR